MSTRLRGAAAVAVGLAALVAAWFLYAQRGYHTPSDAGVVPPAVQTAPPAAPNASAATTIAPRTQAVTTRGSRPTRVLIGGIHVDAPVVPVGVHGGALDVPDDPQSLGWWSHGARAGATAGSVVVVGHVDSWNSGAGALYHLESVPVGARVTVETTGRSVSYTVVGRRVYPKQSLPSSVFATGGAPRLVLITCGGPFDRATRHYADNVVAYAVPLPR